MFLKCKNVWIEWTLVFHNSENVNIDVYRLLANTNNYKMLKYCAAWYVSRKYFRNHDCKIKVIWQMQECKTAIAEHHQCQYLRSTQTHVLPQTRRRLLCGVLLSVCGVMGTALTQPELRGSSGGLTSSPPVLAGASPSKPWVIVLLQVSLAPSSPGWTMNNGSAIEPEPLGTSAAQLSVSRITDGLLTASDS